MPLVAQELPKKVLGKYSDGGGLLFRVTRGGTRDWFLKVQYKGKRKEYALGKYPDLGLSDARAKAREWRSLIKAGIDPRNPTNVPSFRSYAEEHISTKLKNSSRKTLHQWESTLETWVYPFIGNRDVDKVLRKDIEDLLLQRVPGGTLWENKHVTADRVRGRIDAILQRAVNHDLAPKNVALGIKDDLPKVMHQPRHHPSMPFVQINEFLAYLRLSSRANLLTKLAIEFGVLTIARSGEVRGARWEEIKGSEWQLPAERTKQGRPHTVYLSSRAMEILEEARKLRSGPLIFWSPGQREMSDNTLNKSVKQHYVECFADDISPDEEIPTFHGFRASFKTWAEETEVPFSDRVVEAMQGHRVEVSKVRAAYNRAKYIEQRHKLSQLWCDFVLGNCDFVLGEIK